MSVKLYWETTKRIFEVYGGDHFLENFRREFPQLELYSFGTGWLKSKEYILKFRGLHGDLIVRWE